MPYYLWPPRPIHSWIMTTMDLLFLALLQAAFWALTDGVCTFPVELQGKWYQKGIGDMTIAPENITHKGHCVTSAGSFFLLENRGMGCYQCLELLQRHNNVLQYRESYCVERDGLENICGQIKHDDLLHTMVREPAAPMRCPFQDAYHFTYNNNTGGWCRTPTSYVKSCASDARLIFHLKHCPDAAYTYEIDLELVCLASWSDGSETYMFGKFNGPGITGKGNMYRCFMYQILGTVVYLAMSGDATCRGLRSPRDGPFVMEFTKDVFGWPQPQCQFPAWVSRYTWRDLSGRHLYMSNAEGGVVSVRYRYPDDHSDVRTTFRCLRVLQDDQAGQKEFIAMSFTSDECAIRYQCVMFIKRRDGVTEVHQGKYTEYDSEPCSIKDFDRRNSRHLLFPAPTPVTSCPFPGLHRILDTHPGCEGYIHSGCNGSSTLEIVDPCSSQPRVQLECLKTWGGKRRQFIVASKQGRVQDTANCFVMKIRDNVMQFSTDRNCNIGTSDIFHTAVKYSVNPNAERCMMKQEKPKFRPDSDSRHNSERDTGADININNDADGGGEGEGEGEGDVSDEEREQKDQERNANPYRSLNKDAPQSQVATDAASSHFERSTSIFVCDIMLFVTLFVLHMLTRS